MEYISSLTQKRRNKNVTPSVLNAQTRGTECLYRESHRDVLSVKQSPNCSMMWSPGSEYYAQQ